MARDKSRLVYGVGINDANYKLTKYEKIDDKIRQVWICPFYQRWRHVLERCYSEAFMKKNPTYAGCTVCEEWLVFSNFRSWMEEQDWEGNHLDKDLLVAGTKRYSPETCVFVSMAVNSFLTDRARFRGKYMLGVTYKDEQGKYISQCCNLTGYAEFLGRFDTEIEAHLAWKAKKHEHACTLADRLDGYDPRITQALRTRYL